MRIAKTESTLFSTALSVVCLLFRFGGSLTLVATYIGRPTVATMVSSSENHKQYRLFETLFVIWRELVHLLSLLLLSLGVFCNDGITMRQTFDKKAVRFKCGQTFANNFWCDYWVYCE